MKFDTLPCIVYKFDTEPNVCNVNKISSICNRINLMKDISFEFGLKMYLTGNNKYFSTVCCIVRTLSLVLSLGQSPRDN